MRVRAGVAALVSMFLFASSSASAQNLLYWFHIQGGASASGPFTNMSLVVRGGSPKAIRFFSEPSHTLLGVYVDNSRAEDPALQAWATANIPAGTRQQMQITLGEGTKVTLQGPRPAAGDAKIYAHTLYRTAAGDLAEGVFKVTTNVSDFNFGIEGNLPTKTASARGGFVTDGPPAGQIHKIHCGPADGGTCTYSVAQCSTPEVDAATRPTRRRLAVGV